MREEYTEANGSFSEQEIRLINKTGKFLTYPLDVMDTAVEWFELAAKKNWKYYDARGLVVSDTQLDEYIKRLNKVREEMKG